MTIVGSTSSQQCAHVAQLLVSSKSTCCLSDVTILMEQHGLAVGMHLFRCCHDSTSVPAHGCASAAGGQWQTALELFRAMDGMGLPRDAITYSSVISALAKGKQWAHALQARPPCCPQTSVCLKPWASSGRMRCRRDSCCCHASANTTMPGHLQVGWHAG